MDNCIIAIPMKDPSLSKTRLSGALSNAQRQALAISLFQNTVTFFQATYPNCPLATVTASQQITKLASDMGINIIPEPSVEGLNNAANLARSWASKKWLFFAFDHTG